MTIARAQVAVVRIHCDAYCEKTINCFLRSIRVQHKREGHHWANVCRDYYHGELADVADATDEHVDFHHSGATCKHDKCELYITSLTTAMSSNVWVVFTFIATKYNNVNRHADDVT